MDAWWTISNSPLGRTQAFFIAPGNADWCSAYAPNTNHAPYAGSGWISDNASSDFNGPAPYKFSTSFDLSHFVLSTVNIAGNWSIADAGTLDINGHVVAVQTNFPWTSMHPFAVTNPAFLNQGTNTINIKMTVSDTLFEAAF